MKQLIARVDSICEDAVRVAGSNERKGFAGLTSKKTLSHKAPRTFREKVAYTSPISGETTIYVVDRREDPLPNWWRQKVEVDVIGFDDSYFSDAGSVAWQMVMSSILFHVNNYDDCRKGDIFDDIEYFIGVVNHAQHWNHTWRKAIKDELYYFLRKGSGKVRETFKSHKDARTNKVLFD